MSDSYFTEYDTEVGGSSLVLSSEDNTANGSPPKSQRKTRRLFTEEEDIKLMNLVRRHGSKNWAFIAQKMQTRSARQCRERYIMRLSTEVKNGSWTQEEDRLLIMKVNEIGKRWTTIANVIKGRSPNDIKNRYHLFQRNKIKLVKQIQIQMMVDLMSPLLSDVVFPSKNEIKKYKSFVCNENNNDCFIEERNNQINSKNDIYNYCSINSSPSENDGRTIVREENMFKSKTESTKGDNEMMTTEKNAFTFFLNDDNKEKQNSQRKIFPLLPFSDY